jgi:uncharacterized membrane protein
MNLLGRYRNTSTLVRKEQALDLSAAVIGAGLIALVATGSSGLLRFLLALAFTFFVPGRAIVSNWPAVARWSAAASTIVLSLAVLSFLATAALWAHEWHPVHLFEVEASLSLVGLGIGIVRRHSAARTGSWTSTEPSGAR